MVSVQRHVAQLRGSLAAGEREVLWIRAERHPQGEVGALLLTDARLRFAGMAFVRQEQVAWPLAALTAVELSGGKPATLRFTALGAPERFTGREADLRRLAEALGDRPAAQPGGLVVELERLAALQDAGVLTAEEFAAAKARLLG
ncbi:SHOCT domain-containing protein [Amnibacterium endophyticum]|uniref:SHOCT domain-containing protein n=1 Tax=Amnibacterium endophyticum TaxID=2109337 RepID=A0ABW4L9J2_9MICO